MDLKSGYPYWAVKNGLMYAFPQLDAELSCDVDPLTALFSFARLGCQ